MQNPKQGSAIAGGRRRLPAGLDHGVIKKNHASTSNDIFGVYTTC